MAFRLKRANCVVAGTFNMYIVQPAWLAKVGIVPKGIAVTVGSKLDEPGFREGTARLRADWLAMPSPNDVVAVLEKLTAHHRTRA